jgi:hypothetical protein
MGVLFVYTVCGERKEHEKIIISLAKVREYVVKFQKSHVFGECPSYREAIYHGLLAEHKRAEQIIPLGDKKGFEVHYEEISEVLPLSVLLSSVKH